MTRWHPDPLGRRGKPDVVRFLEYYGSPITEFYDTSVTSMVKKASVIYGSMFGFGYFETRRFRVFKPHVSNLIIDPGQGQWPPSAFKAL